MRPQTRPWSLNTGAPLIPPSNRALVRKQGNGSRAVSRYSWCTSRTVPVVVVASIFNSWCSVPKTSNRELGYPKAAICDPGRGGRRESRGVSHTWLVFISDAGTRCSTAMSYGCRYQVLCTNRGIIGCPPPGATYVRVRWEASSTLFGARPSANRSKWSSTTWRAVIASHGAIMQAVPEG
jgi:hypothetical protein